MARVLIQHIWILTGQGGVIRKVIIWTSIKVGRVSLVGAVAITGTTTAVMTTWWREMKFRTLLQRQRLSRVQSLMLRRSHICPRRLLLQKRLLWEVLL